MKRNNMSRMSISWGKDELPIELPVNLMGKKTFHPEELAKHTLVIGGTGSGKTSSAIKPMLRGFWDYLSKDQLRYSMLVVDPKCELSEYLAELDERDGTNRLIVLSDPDVPRLNPFEGMTELENFTDRVEAAFNMFEGNQEFSGDNSVFRDGGLALLRDFAELEEACYQLSSKSVFSILAQVIRPDIKQPNFFDGVELLIQGTMNGKFFSDSIDLSRFDFAWNHIYAEACKFDTNAEKVSVFDLLSAIVAFYAPSEIVLCERFDMYAKDLHKRFNSREMIRQFGYYASYIKTVTQVFNHPRFKAVFDWEKAMDNVIEQSGQIGRWLDEGKTLVVTPETGVLVDEFVMRFIKQAAFKHMLTRANKLAPMAYVADEFQNYISSDIDTGEQNFLDRCRSYRVSCVLATQSIAALKERVLRQEARAGDSALMSMMNNLNNRLIFATKDPDTVSLLKRWIEMPSSLSQSHVVENFPPAALSTGQCYWLRDAQWSRSQVVLEPESDQEYPEMRLG